MDKRFCLHFETPYLFDERVRYFKFFIDYGRYCNKKYVDLSLCYGTNRKNSDMEFIMPFVGLFIKND